MPTPLRRLPLSLPILLTLAHPPLTGQQLLGYPTIVPGHQRAAFAIGDLDGDLRADLVATDQAGGRVSICVGDGAGNFSLVRSLAVGALPTDVELEDLDGDGRLDIITTNFGSNNVSVLRGVGGGNFAAAVNYPVGNEPQQVAVARIDGDAVLDLVTANYTGSVSILRGLGNGTFSSAVSPSAGVRATGVVVGDWNLDGRPDLAVANYTGGQITLMMGLTNLFFQPVPIAFPGEPFRIATADLNRDGRPDLVVSNRQFSGQVVVMLGNGAGGFTARPGVGVGNYPADVAIADFDADGRDDVAVGSSWPGILRGDGNGGLAALNSPSSGPSAGSRQIAVADLDHDGRTDLVGSEEGMFDRAWFWPGIGAAFDTTPLIVGTVPASVAVGDVSGDGVPDVVAGNRDSNSVSLLANDGSGRFPGTQTIPIAAQPVAIAVGDLDGDARADVVTANAGNTVSVLLDDDAGGLRSPLVYPAGIGPIAVAIADMNRDGRNDVVVLNGGSQRVSVLLQGTGGGFALPLAFALNAVPSAFAIADFDGDGAVDVWVALASTSTVALLRNVGFGSLSLHALAPTISTPNGLAVGDVDRDGMPDMVLTGLDRIAVFRGNGGGGFSTSTVWSLRTPPRAPVLADFNGDNRLDLAVSFPDSGLVSVMPGDGTGFVAFGAGVPTVVQAQPLSLAVADLDRDGTADLVSGNSNPISNGIAVLLGRGLLPFGFGTAGCNGMLGINGARPAKVGRADFGITTTNAPRNSSGTLMLGLAPDFAGTNLAPLGLVLHVNTALPVISQAIASGVGGVGFASLPIPPNAALAGARLYPQTVWLEVPGSGRACSGAFLRLVSSRGLAIRIVP